jgi:hypothetical protein
LVVDTIAGGNPIPPGACAWPQALREATVATITEVRAEEGKRGFIADSGRLRGEVRQQTATALMRAFLITVRRQERLRPR